MFKRFVAVGFTLMLTAGTRADYPADRQAAVSLYTASKFDEALGAFRTMSAGNVTDFQKSDALEQAALCAYRLGRNDLAQELARTIPIAPISKCVQMNYFGNLRKWKEVVAKFKDEDIAGWPDEIAGRSFFYRAQAYAALGDGANATEEFKKALAYPLENGLKGSILQGLGDAYQYLLKDDEQALSAYRQLFQAAGARYMQLHAVLSAANILIRQNKGEEAIRELNRMELNGLTGLWRCQILCAHGNALARQGKKTESRLKYAEALGIQGLSPEQSNTVQKAMTDLE